MLGLLFCEGPSCLFLLPFFKRKIDSILHPGLNWNCTCNFYTTEIMHWSAICAFRNLSTVWNHRTSCMLNKTLIFLLFLFSETKTSALLYPFTIFTILCQTCKFNLVHGSGLTTFKFWSHTFTFQSPCLGESLFLNPFLQLRAENCDLLFMVFYSPLQAGTV